MFSPFERMLAWRYLRSRKAEGFVSVIAGFSFLGIMLGVATLIIVMSVMNGFRAELVDRILGLNGHISVYSTGTSLVNYGPIAYDISQIDGVVSAAPVIERQALVSYNNNATGAVIRGMTGNDIRRKDVLYSGIIQGDLNDFIGNNIAIGVELAKRLGVKKGSTLTLVSPQFKSGPFGSIPRSKRYTVSIIFDVGMYEYNKGFIFMPLSEAQRFFSKNGSVDYIELRTENAEDLTGLKARLFQSLPQGLRVNDWRQSNGSFYNALQVERNVMFLILTLIILVAAFNIISSMIMLVKDKARDIAIMRTYGAGAGSVLRVFFLTGASIGIIGTLAGAGLGISFALNIETIRQFLESLTGTELFAAEIYFLSQLPAVLDWGEIATVIGMALLPSLGATLYPAWRASRLEPVEVLRYE